MQKHKIKNQTNQSFVTLTTKYLTVVRPFQWTLMMVNIPSSVFLIFQNKRIVSDVSLRASLTSQQSLVEDLGCEYFV